VGVLLSNRKEDIIEKHGSAESYGNRDESRK